MVSDRLTRWAAAAAAALILINVHVNPLTVLCISDSGHIEFEAAGSSCCVQDAATSPPIHPQPLAASDDCGACMDVLLSQDVARIAAGIQAGPNYLAPSGPLPDALVHPLVVPGDRNSQELISLLGLTGISVAPSRLSTVIRC